ncbi:AAA family ATPase [Mammaliicoccus sciuri]
MKEIKLMKLTLKNFKGIKDFTLDLNGENARIFGDNETGKTSLYDAFLWLLFNKNSQNQAKFSLKTLTPEGEEMNNLEHEVEASFLVDDCPLVLKKIHYEDWTQKRNAFEKTFKGNTNKYFIDEVPTPEKKYNEAIKELIDEEVFKLLTSPTYFNEQFKWEKRREVLLGITGDLTDEEVISANKTLQELTGILNGRKIEDHKKVIAAKKKKINEEIKSIPTRISEINNMLPEGDIDVSSIKVEIAKVEKEIDAASTQINNIKNGSAIAAKQNDLRQLEMDLESIKRALESDATEQGYKVQARIQEEQSNISIIQRKADDAKHQVAILQKDVQRLVEKMDELRDQWHKANGRTLDHKEECECPTCGQSLPEEGLRAAREKAEEAFNLSKSEELERIDKLGGSYKADKAELLEKIAKLEKQLPSHTEEILVKEKLVEKLTVELNQLRESIQDARQDPKYTNKQQEIQKVKDKIESLKSSADEAVSTIEKEVSELKVKRSELNSQIAKHEQSKASKKRIAELEEQQEELAKEFESVEKELFLIEEFTRIKVEMLDEKINSKFKMARFKLTHKQVDGTLVDVCETTYKGVPYGSGLNNAAKINVGLDIIQTLSDHYGFRVPIFVDNAEAVTRIADTDSQLISLVVSEKDKQLRIESQSDKESEVA